MIINVEQQDIDIGICGDPWCCPVANALKRISGEKAVVGVGWADVGERGFRLPADVRQKISKFDACGEMEPFTFEVKRCYSQHSMS